MFVAARPNILFWFADDQRFDTIRALGNDGIHTPNLDRLVARGTAFTRAHIPSGTVGAVCMPSPAMLMVVRALFHIGHAGRTIPPEHVTLGQALQQNGYRAFGCGKWHNGRESWHRSFTEGNELVFLGMADHWNVPAYRYDPTGRYDSVLYQVKDPERSNEVTELPRDHIHVSRHSSEVLADTAVKYLREYDGKDPFFMYVSFLAPHDPRTMPKEYRDMYDPAATRLPPNFMRQHPFHNGHHGRDEKLTPLPRSPEEIKRHLAEYYAMITHLDAQVGRILDTLEERGLAENTIIVYSADNGLAVDQHGLMGKQNCYDYSVRVPLIFAGPGIPRGERRDAFCYLLDIYPTLCELTRTEIPSSVEGKSLLPVIKDPGAQVRDTLYFAFRGLHRGVRTSATSWFWPVYDASVPAAS